jgi:3-oxoacyl-[acyl-carrier-protein] synthase III
MPINISALSYHLPENSFSNADLHELHPEWPVEKIYNKTGIRKRHFAKSEEYSIDLAIQAAKKLFTEHSVQRRDIDFIIFCTQTPKYLIPTSACILQHALGISTSAGAIDVNQGCSGYVYSLMLAEGLIESKIAKNILLITADTYTKLVDPYDRGLKTIFGDAATASLVTKNNLSTFRSGIYEYGTDGSGAETLIAKNSGMHRICEQGNPAASLFMDGAAIFKFTLEKIPHLVESTLVNADLCPQDVDLYIFHQANSYMLEHLRQKIGIARDKFFLHLAEVGNTVSSSIPIAIYAALREKRIKAGSKVMLVGFGVGLSWAATIIEF